MNGSRLALACAGAVALGLVLWLGAARLRGRTEGVGGASERTPSPAPALRMDAAPVDAAPGPLREASPAPGRETGAESGPAIRGRATLPGGAPCAGGTVLAWLDGTLPGAEEFRAPDGPVGPDGKGAPERERPLVQRATTAADGTFALRGLDPALGYTLSAVAPGALCVARVNGIAVGATGVELGLVYTYGVTIRLREAGGGALRSTPSSFGRGRRFSGEIETLDELPYELLALGIAGLEEGASTVDRMRILAVSGREEAELGPFDALVKVPGYRSRSEFVPVPRLIASLPEAVLELERDAEGWGSLDVHLVAGPSVLGLERADDAPIGVLYLSLNQRGPLEVGLHGRALVASEPIPDLPTGPYSFWFEGKDSAYESRRVELELVAGANTLALDVSEAGTLLLEVRAGDEPLDGALTARFSPSDGAPFYATFPRPPYALPFVTPGRYRLAELAAADGACRLDRARDLEILAGKLTFEVVNCAGGR